MKPDTDSPMTAPPTDADNSDRPPLFGTWGRMYAFVLFFLMLLIVAFYFFGRTFS